MSKCAVESNHCLKYCPIHPNQNNVNIVLYSAKNQESIEKKDWEKTQSKLTKRVDKDQHLQENQSKYSNSNVASFFNVIKHLCKKHKEGLNQYLHTRDGHGFNLVNRTMTILLSYFYLSKALALNSFLNQSSLFRSKSDD